MNKIAYIINGRVACIVDSVHKNKKLKKKATETLVDITDIDPFPSVGYRYNSDDGTFLPEEDMTEAEFEVFDSATTVEYFDSETYSECRKADYPEIGEQLGIICGTLKYIREQNIDLGESGDSLIDAIDKVKEAHNKKGYKVIFPKR